MDLDKTGQKIRSIQVVCSMGAGDKYTVGEHGITEIKQCYRSITTDTDIYPFAVFKGDDIVTEISPYTPYILTY